VATEIPSLDRLIDNYLQCCTAEGKSRKTIEWYEANLKRFSQFLKREHLGGAISDIGPPEARRFILHLQNDVRRWETSPFINDTKGLSPHTIHGYASAIKAFWSWLPDEGYTPENCMTRLKCPRTPRKIIPTFSAEQIQRLLGALDPGTPTGFRDYAIILVFIDTGIRLSELVNLRLEDIDFGQSCFLVNGKGNKERVVPFGSQVRRALWRYLGTVRPDPESSQVSRFFLSRQGFPLKPRAVQSMISRAGRRANVSGVRCSPHTFRHTFAKQYLLNGGDVFSLQRILGHASLEIVRLYVNLTSLDVSRQHRKFSPVDTMGLSVTRSRKRHPAARGFASSTPSYAGLHVPGTFPHITRT
jgi:site-specific recombinase XerD